MLYAVLASSHDKASDDFKQMVISIVDQVNESTNDKDRKMMKRVSKSSYNWKHVQNILNKEYDGKIIEELGEIQTPKD